MSRYDQVVIWLVRHQGDAGIVVIPDVFCRGRRRIVSRPAGSIHLALLAVVWCPGSEFTEALASYQKVATVARLLVSAPILLLAGRAAS